jgi:hypothetical protein
LHGQSRSTLTLSGRVGFQARAKERDGIDAHMPVEPAIFFENERLNQFR